jgi:hypothetical protein
MLTAPEPTPAPARWPGKLSTRERELVTLVAQGRTNAQTPPSCTSASARSPRTWTVSGTRPAAVAAPTLTRLALSAGMI